AFGSKSATGSPWRATALSSAISSLCRSIARRCAVCWSWPPCCLRSASSSWVMLTAASTASRSKLGARALARSSRILRSSRAAASTRPSRSSGAQAIRNSRSISRSATGSLLVGAFIGSTIAFERLQSLDHRLDPAARLLVAREQVGAFARQLLLAVPQAAIFLAEPAHGVEQAVDLAAERLQLQLDGVRRKGVGGVH